MSGDHSERHALVEAEGISSDESACDKYLAKAADLFASKSMTGIIILLGGLLIVSLLLQNFRVVAFDNFFYIHGLLIVIPFRVMLHKGSYVIYYIYILLNIYILVYI